MATTPVVPSKVTSSLTALSVVNSSQGLKIGLTELNPHFVCVLCFGYFVDATTITECMHTFCKSCIVNFLKSNHHCPHCDTLLSRTRPFNSLRQDRMMQTLVYKTVPGLFQTEMRRRIQFYQSHPHQELEPDVEDIQNYIFSPEDSVSLSIRYYNAVSQIAGDDIWDTAGTNSKNNLDVDDINAIRYFRCPATVPMSVLKALVKTKYGIPDPFRVELLYGEERLLDTWTLMEVAYIFKWNRDSPMELSFQVFVTRKVKRKRLRLVKKPKVKDKENEKNVPLGNQEENREEDDTCSEPPLKIPRIRESRSPYGTSPEEHHQRPPTPPETPDGPADINLYTDHIKSPKSSPSWIPSPRRDTSGSLKIILKSTNVVTRRKDNKASSSSEEDEPKESINSTQSEMDPFDKLMEETNSKFIDDNRRYDLGDNMGNDDCPMDEDGDSGDYAGDQDSEAPLEVDTSHETEPEADNDGDVDFSQEDLDTYKQECQKEEDIDEEEQGDSAIDVTETSASEVVDSDDKDTDFNMSSESIDVDSHCRKVSGHSGTIENGDSKVKTEESFSDHSENSDYNKDRKDNNSNASGVPDMGGALDLSCHARTVRARRENSQSPVASTNYLSSDNETKMQGLQALLTTSLNGTPKQSPNGSPMHGQQIPLMKTSTSVVTGTNLLTSSLVTSPRPPLPLDWVRPPMGNGPAVPHAAAFNLMTLSHAAVQLQLAMAHAQAQAQVQAQVHAQAHVQAQAQKIQAQVQANVLKNLKATETLSFVNGSGDTLTISPIPCNQGNIAKSKLTTKMKSVKSVTANHNSLNYNKTASAKSKLTNNQKTAKSNKEHVFQNGVNSVNKNSIANANTNNNTSTTNNNKVLNTQQTANIGKTSQNNSIKTVIPKSALTSLRIPTVSLHTKTHVFKPDKEKKQAEKERTGDPVFKITNQKLIEFVRQQHLHKLKQSSKHNPTSDGISFKTSNDCISTTVNITSKPTLAVVPTSIADGGNKVSCNSNNASNKLSKNNFINKPATSTILNKSHSSPNTKAISSPQIKSPVTSIGKSQPSLSKSSITPSKPQHTLTKSQPTSLVKPMQPPNLNKGPISNISKPHQTCLNKSQVSLLNKPQFLNQIKPSQSPTLNKHPQSPTLNKPPQSPTLNKPSQSPTLNKPSHSPTLNKPPQSPSLNKPPQSPTLTKSPQSPTSNKPQPPSLNKSQYNPNKTTFNSPNKSIILNKSPMISLNKITVNSINKPAAIPSVTKLPNSFANNPASPNTNDNYTNNNNVTINGATTTSQCNIDGSQTKSTIAPSKPLTLTSSSPVTPTANTLRTTNTNVRQIPNPSRLTHQAENRLSSGIRLGTLAKKGVTTSKSEGMSRIESLTRTLHEKASAASGVAAGVLSSFAR